MGTDIILKDTFSVVVHPTQIGLGIGITLFGVVPLSVELCEAGIVGFRV